MRKSTMMFSLKSSYSLTQYKTRQCWQRAHSIPKPTGPTGFSYRSLPLRKPLSTSSLLPATSSIPPARPWPQPEDNCASSVLVTTPPPCLSTALGSTVPITAPMCHRQPSTRCPMARGCPPCLPPSCRHLNCPTFLGQAAKTASAAVRKGKLRPLAWAESLGSTQRMEIPPATPGISCEMGKMLPRHPQGKAA